MNNGYPPSYEQATRQHASLTGDLTIMDFLPLCLDEGGLFSNPKYQPFSDLIERANQWLQARPLLEVKTCESVEFKLGEEEGTESTTYLETCRGVNQFIRGLRLWLAPRTDPSRPPQYLKYFNLVPDSLETLDDVLRRFNETLNSSPLSGRILTVETQEMKIPSSGAFDPDKSYWSEAGNHERQFIFVLRIFYEYGSAPAQEDLGIKDFIPQIINPNEPEPFYETFSILVKRASAWCAKQDFLRFCHAQSVEIKIKGGIADTRRMTYTEHSSRDTHYLRILRVVYTKPTVFSHEFVNPPKLLLTYKTFMPLSINNQNSELGYESLFQVKQRLKTWVNATNAHVLSVETAAMRLYTGGEAALGPEAGYTYNFYNRDEHWVFVIRLYLDGIYEDPFTVALPPPIDVAESGCCALV